ncbi:MAG: hypothetical protein ABW123_18830, partial [Cystobacter sp.]
MVLQFPLHLEGAVNESGLFDDQVAGSHLQDDGAILQRQVGTQVIKSFATGQYQSLALYLLIFEDDVLKPTHQQPSKMSCAGIPLGNSRKGRNHFNFASPNNSMS